MDAPSLNHYEEQLYSMFKSFDVNNEEALDESAVHALCDALQLEERGAVLADTLFEERAGRVTFERFRSGLLSVLGDEAPAAARPPEPPPPDLEPRFVFGSKKYGRRSRPAQAEPASPRAASASRLEAARGAARPRVRRSTSAAPHPDALAHDARIDGEGALALCRDLRMDAIDRRIVERIFEDSPTPDTTVGEFFERLDSTLARAVSGAADAGAKSRCEARLPVERLLEEWERAGVRRPRRLLAELGFGEAALALDAAELERALDAELRAGAAGAGAGEEGEERARLLTAALALARARGAVARRRADAAACERDKLRADVAEANARAALLAREVDENLARIELESKETLRRATARHAEEARRARAEAEAELERAGGERARLEAEVARRGEAEARLREETEELTRLRASLERRLGAAEAALEAARGERARLTERLGAAEARAAAAAAGAAQEAEAQAQRAAAGERRRLQDRADELAAALEAARAVPPLASPAGSCDANLSAELGALLELESSKSITAATKDGTALEQTSRLNSEINSSIRDRSIKSDMSDIGLFPSIGARSAVEQQPAETEEMIETSAPVDVEMTNPKSIEVVEAKLMEALETKVTMQTKATMEAEADAMDVDEERERLRELVKELESALDAMRLEYEACEEYWARKQREERDAHDAELRAADARLAALLARVAAFERRLAPPPPALPAVPEAPALEAQVAALEREGAAAARDAAARLQRALDQLARAQRRLAALQRRRGGDAGAGAGEAPAPCARCRRLEAGGAAAGARALRAEAAARRLAARLVAADVLVKELYVENCQLARHPP